MQLRRIAQAEGFSARVRRVEPEAFRHLPLPALVHLRFIHFAVIEGVRADAVLLNDPGPGPHWLPMGEFARDFTGVAMWLERGPSWRGRPFSWFRTLRRLLRAALWDLVWAALLGLGGGLAAGAAVLTGAAAMEAALVRDAAGAWQGLALAAGASGAALGLRHAGRPVAEGALARVAARAEMRVFGRAWLRARCNPTRPGAVARQIVSPAELTRGGLAECLVALPAAVVLLVGAAVLAPPPVLLPLALLMPLEVWFAIGPVVSRAGAGGHARPGPVLKAQPPTAGFLDEPGWSRLGDRDGALFARWAGLHAIATDDALRGELARGQGAALAQAVSAGRASVLLALGLGGWIGGGEAVAALALSVLLSALIAGVAEDVRLGALRAALNFLDDAVPRDLAPVPAAPGRQVCAGPASLTITALRWPALGRLVFDGLDVTVPPGAVVAVTGHGKTMLLRLVLGQVVPAGGEVLIDGTRSVHAPDGRAIGVPARPGLPSLRVADVLAPGRRVPADVLRAALIAVELWPALAPRGGLDLVLTREGAGLSGGQRRRLALARALLAEPGLLALDGTLDHLDQALAARMVALLRARGVTVLLATNRADIADLAERRLHLVPPG